MQASFYKHSNVLTNIGKIINSLTSIFESFLTSSVVNKLLRYLLSNVRLTFIQYSKEEQQLTGLNGILHIIQMQLLWFLAHSLA